MGLLLDININGNLFNYLTIHDILGKFLTSKITTKSNPIPAPENTNV
jgi:hypothetical protein